MLILQGTLKRIDKKVTCSSLGQEFLVFCGPILGSISYFLLVDLLQFWYDLLGQLRIPNQAPLKHIMFKILVFPLWAKTIRTRSCLGQHFLAKTDLRNRSSWVNISYSKKNYPCVSVYSLGVPILEPGTYSLEWDPTIWDPTVWDPTVSGYRFWSRGRTHLSF